MALHTYVYFTAYKLDFSFLNRALNKAPCVNCLAYSKFSVIITYYCYLCLRIPLPQAEPYQRFSWFSSICTKYSRRKVKILLREYHLTNGLSQLLWAILLFFFFFFSPVLVCEHISILCLYVGPRPSEQVNLSVPTRVKQEYWRDQDKLSGASLDKATVLWNQH